MARWQVRPGRRVASGPFHHVGRHLAGFGRSCVRLLVVSDRAFRGALTLAAALAVTVRIAFIRIVRPVVPEFGDAETYRLLAEVLADGGGYVRPREFLFTGERIATGEFPPLWPMVLAVFQLFGFDSPNEQRAVGALIGASTVVVVGLLGAALGGRRIGVVAAVLAAVHPQMVVLDTSLLSEGLAMLLVAAALWCVAQARLAADGLLGPIGMRWWTAASVALGLASLTRSEVILLALLVVVVASRAPQRAVWAKTATLGLLGVIVCLGAWTVRNAISLGDAQPFTNNSGTLIAGSNCDAVYSGSQIGLWRFDCVVAIDTTGMDEVAASAERRAVGIDYAQDHLRELPSVAAVRLLRTFGAWDVRTQLYVESLEGRDYDWLWAGWIGWVMTAIAATGGVVATRIGRGLRCDLWLVLVPVGVVAFTALVSYGNQRFRAIAEPGMLVVAAVGVVAFVDFLRRAQGTQEPGGSS